MDYYNILVTPQYTRVMVESNFHNASDNTTRHLWSRYWYLLLIQISQHQEPGCKHHSWYFREDCVQAVWNMESIFNVIYLLGILLYLTRVNGKCGSDLCKRKQYTSTNGYYHQGKVITVYEDVPLKMCIRRCRIYLECRSFNMKWINPSRTFGTCTLLQEVILMPRTKGAIYDENYTHYCKFSYVSNYIKIIICCISIHFWLDEDAPNATQWCVGEWVSESVSGLVSQSVS